MPFLTLNVNGRILGEYPLEHNRTVKIGRLEDNDIIISDSSVSGNHAEVEFENGRFFLTDRQSKNGTFVNKQLVISRELKHGDRITIGNHTLVFAYRDKETRPDDDEETPYQATMAIDTSRHRSRLAHSISEMVSLDSENRVLGILSFLSGDRPVVKLDKEKITIGKNAASDIITKGFMVGGTAAVINRLDGYYTISCLEGRAKLKVNYKTVKSVIRLKEFDVIEIGSIKMQFHYQHM
ncbi:MAG: FHA domain-containing protein [Candidatus Neomarinimicrobiota bacterium]|nr:MAG: FHA domain-containing protein [Candidatus Neomarinimicrobiota bacterium]